MAVKRLLYILIGLLLLPALFIHLGKAVFIDDEGIRALVAQEMIWQDNYWVPTLHGDPYLNKPPLWNWLLVLSFSLFGEANEWSSRFPTVVALLGFALTAYRFSRPYFGKSLAFIHAFTVISCGRMLFWDSMLGLIDVCFSWAIYGSLLALFHYGQQKRWVAAFGYFYVGVALAFLLKGLPAFTFGAFTLLAYVWWQKAWWQLLRPAHLLSGLMAVAIIGAYYWQYSQYMDIKVVADRLLEESSKRTAVHHGWQATIKQLLSFPFEMFYHFMPWTLLVVFFFAKGSRQRIQAQPLVVFMLLAFAVNLPLYWSSPNVYPRYLLMLFPLLFGVGLWLYEGQRQAKTKLLAYFHRFLLLAMLLCSLLFFFIPLVPKTEVVAFRWVWASSSGLGGLYLSYLAYLAIQRELGKPVPLKFSAGSLGKRWQATLPTQAVLLTFIAFLLLLRLVFNVFVLPPRAVDDHKGRMLKASATALGHRFATDADSLAVLGFSLMEPATSFYLSKAYGRVVPRRFDTIYANEVYIISPWQYPEAAQMAPAVDSLFMRHQALAPHYPALPLHLVPTISGSSNSPASATDEEQAAIPFKTDFEGPLWDGMGTGLWRKQ